LIPQSEGEVTEYAQRLNFAKEFHLDVVDGVFAPKATWPYQPEGKPLNVKQYLDVYTLEVDLMTTQPVQAAEQWIKAGADMLVFHVETLSVEVLKNFTEETPVSVGVSCSGATTMDTFAQYLPYADYVQLMGIYQIGAQGQPFDETVFEKITYIKEHYPHLAITVDGSVNQDTIGRLKAAGVDRFVVGSAITLQDDPESAYTALNTLINE